MHYPLYTFEGTKTIINKEWPGEDNHYLERNSLDFKYDALDVNIILAFMKINK